MSAFSEKTVKGFLALVGIAVFNRPRSTMVEMVIRWRAVANNQTSQDVVNFTSYLIEKYSRDNLGSLPVLFIDWRKVLQHEGYNV